MPVAAGAGRYRDRHRVRWGQWSGTAGSLGIVLHPQSEFSYFAICKTF